MMLFKNFLVIGFIYFVNCSHTHGREITIPEIKDLFLKNNQKIQLAAIDYQIARSEYDAAFYPFDPELTLNYSTDKTQKLPNSTLDRTMVTELKKGPSFGFMRKFSFGHEVAVTIQNLYIKTDSLVSRLPERYQSSGQVKLTLPLMKNSTKTVNEELIDVSNLKIKEKKTDLTKIVNLEFANTFKDYLAWILAYEDYKNNKQSERNSFEYFNSTKKQYELGKKNIIELDEGEAVWLKKKAQLIGAEKKLFSTKYAFLRNICSEKNIQDWMETTPVTEFSKLDLTLYKGIAPRLKLEDIKYWEWEQDKRKAETTQYNLKPEFNFTLTAISNGLNQTASEAMKQTFQYAYPTWEFKLEIKFPWDNSLAKGQNEAAIAKSQGSYYSYMDEKRKVLLSENQMSRDLEKVNQKIQESGHYVKIAELKWNRAETLHAQGKISDLEWLTTDQDFQEALHEHNQEQIKKYEIELDLLASKGQLISLEELE